VFDELGGLGPTGAQSVALAEALGRVLAEDLVPVVPVPAEPRAAMDGFAVRTATLASGPLRVRGTLPAGVPAGLPLGPGETVYMATGAPLPPGADAVLPREQADWDGEDPPAPGTWVRCRRPVAPGEHVVRPGEWVAAGVPVLPRGHRMDPWALGVAAALGRERVAVRPRPSVILIPTGDELVRPGAALRPAGTFDSNAPMLEAACREAGAEVVVWPPAPDDADALRAVLARALGEGPTLVLTTGGVSVGPRDAVPAAWRALGARQLFWRIAIKPGKPVFAARSGATAALGLSGSPLACAVAFHLLVGPLLRHWAGWERPFPPAALARLAEALPRRADVPRLWWAHVDGRGLAHPAPQRASGSLLHMARANALILQGAGEGPLPEGAEVWTLRLDRLGEEGVVAPRALLAALARPRGPLPLPEPVPSTAAQAVSPRIWAVAGRRGHGKTTLVEGLVRALTAAGEVVWTVKHHGEATPLEAPDKDGYRHRAAGARVTVVSGPGGYVWSEAVDGEVPFAAWAAALRRRAREAGVGWILVEGYREARVPRVEVVDTARATEPLSRPEDGLRVVAASDPTRVRAPAGVAVLHRDDVAGILAVLRAAGTT
jgi:molybdopterin molybdotransferase